MISLVLRFLLVASLALPSTAWAYGEGGGYGANRLSNATTKKVANLLTKGVRNCQRLENVYRYDCYRRVYGQAAQELDRNPAYAAARDILLDVEKALGRTVERNLDPAAPQVRLGQQQFRAIRPAALPAAKRDFIATLDSAETRLLRSPGQNGTHFVRIAEAIGSNKLLLRSGLLVIPGASILALVLPGDRAGPLLADRMPA